VFTNETILITGGTGTLGAATVARVLKYAPREIRILSRNELSQQRMRQLYKNAPLKFYLGSVEDEYIVERAIAGCDTVFHYAAMKYADMAEKQPQQTILSNVVGTMNIVNLAIKYGVNRVVGISTDKAVRPNGVYGMSKKMMEYLFMAANDGDTATKFFVARSGNIFGSTGSVVEIWRRAAANHEALKITDPEMTRLFAGADDVVDLIFRMLIHGDPGGIYFTRMKAIKMIDLATEMQSRGVEYSTNRGGEKIHESLVTGEEMTRAIELTISGADLPPAPIYMIGNHKLTPDAEDYASDTAQRMTKDEIGCLIRQYESGRNGQSK